MKTDAPPSPAPAETQKPAGSEYTRSPLVRSRRLEIEGAERLSDSGVDLASNGSWLARVDRPPSLNLFTDECGSRPLSGITPPFFERGAASKETDSKDLSRPVMKISSQLINPTFKERKDSEDGFDTCNGDGNVKGATGLRPRNNSVRSLAASYPFLPLSKQSSQINLAASPEAPKQSVDNHFFQNDAFSRSPERERAFALDAPPVAKRPAPLPPRLSSADEEFVLDAEALVTPTFKYPVAANTSPVRQFNFPGHQRAVDRLLPRSFIQTSARNARGLTSHHKRSKTETALNLPRISAIEAPAPSDSQDASIQFSLRLSRFERDYRVIAVIGHGRHGRVYHVESRVDRLQYVVKEISRTAVESRDGENEVQALAAINARYNSKYFVRYHCAWSEEGCVFLCMEKCVDSLAALRRQRPGGCFPEETLRRVLRHICKALKKVHRDSIVHLDVKPENILFSANKKFKLADFGLARNLRLREDVLAVEEGDCRYMARELLEPGSVARDYTKCDIFSLGISMFELMVGDRVVLPQNGSLWQDLRCGQIPFLAALPGYSTAFKRLVALMMARNPALRPSANEILKKHLTKFYRNYERFLKRRIEYLQSCEGAQNPPPFTRPKSADPRLLKTVFFK